ncbi:MAG: aldehyde reductase [Pseudomonadales bacterium]|nr:aldehyde reductase [Pseudomonadales bacterium]
MNKTVLVTGASGFIAGHCILDLLNAGYNVRGTVRDLSRAPAIRETLARHNARAADIEFVTADLMDADSWREAVTGCDGVYHVASPVPVIQPKNPDEVIVPAREGTLNLLGAAREAGIQRVVLTSSTASVFSNSRESGVFTGSDWTDLTKKDLSPYIRSKTVAERAAWDFVEGGGPELAVVNPGLVMGPALESDYGSSLEVLVKLLRGDFPFLPRLGFECVDVRDVASLHRLALETPEAVGQRFLCANGFWWLKDIAQALKADFPAFRISSREMPDFLVRVASLFIKEIEQFADDVGRVKKVDNAPARSIGWQPRDIEVAIRDGAQSLIDLGIVKAG